MLAGVIDIYHRCGSLAFFDVYIAFTIPKTEVSSYNAEPK